MTTDGGGAGNEASTPSGGGGGQSVDFQALLAGLEDGEFDAALTEIGRRQQYLRWRRLPDKIALLRHGQSEGNINRAIYTSKGDAHLELTPQGLQQAREAGARLSRLVGEDRVFVVVSPFERTQQTLLGLYQGGFPEDQVAMVHVSSQIREQEFGNFQSVGLHEAARAEQAVVGRYYYRRPNAESSADVYDRVTAFWDELLNDLLAPQNVAEKKKYGTCLVVTHGLTMRLILMKIFQWSVETFETVWNVDNCCHITLRKDMDSMSYKLCPETSFPRQMPWATRPVWIVFKSKKAKPETEEKLHMLEKFKASKDWGILRKECYDETVHSTVSGELLSQNKPTHAHSDVPGHWLEIDRAIDETQNKRMKERSEPYTVLDYLTIPQPRTTQREALYGRLLPGHLSQPREQMLQQASTMEPIDWSDVEAIDWWGSVLSYQGKMLRSQVTRGRLVRHMSCAHDSDDGDDGDEEPAPSIGGSRTLRNSMPHSLSLL